jgi:hypothetical protein
MMLALDAAFVAKSDATGHPLFLQPLQTRIIGREFLVERLDGVAQVFGDRLFNPFAVVVVLHDYFSLPDFLLDVKG